MTAHITIEGGLTADAELKFGPSGTAILGFSVAEQARRFNRDTNQWEDAGDPSYWNVTVWSKRAETLAETGQLVKGARVVVAGYPSLRKFERRDGSSGLSGEVRAESVAVVPSNRGRGGSPAAQQRPQASQGGFGGSDAGASAFQDPWGGASSFPETPPF